MQSPERFWPEKLGQTIQVSNEFKQLFTIMVTDPRYRWTPQDCLRSDWFNLTTADHNEIRTEFELRRDARMASQALPAHALNHEIPDVIMSEPRMRGIASFDYNAPLDDRKLRQLVFDPERTHFGFARIKAALLTKIVHQELNE